MRSRHQKQHHQQLSSQSLSSSRVSRIEFFLSLILLFWNGKFFSQFITIGLIIVSQIDSETIWNANNNNNNNSMISNESNGMNRIPSNSKLDSLQSSNQHHQHHSEHHHNHQQQQHHRRYFHKKSQRLNRFSSRNNYEQSSTLSSRTRSSSSMLISIKKFHNNVENHFRNCSRNDRNIYTILLPSDFIISSKNTVNNKNNNDDNYEEEEEEDGDDEFDDISQHGISSLLSSSSPPTSSLLSSTTITSESKSSLVALKLINTEMFVDELQPIELLRNFSTTSIPIEIFSKSFDDDNQLSDQNSIIDRNNQSIEIRRIDSFEELELLNKNWQILIITLYTLTAIVALIGNLIAICVLVFGRRSSKELRFFLVNLSLSDILMAIFSIPFTYLDFMLGRWIFAPSFCPIVQQIQITCVIVSVYTLTAIGIDRYIAIIYPLFSQRYSRSFVPIVLILIWSFGLLIGLYQWSNTIAKPFQVANETAYDCTEIAKDQSQMFTIVSFVLTFALPVSILTFVYFSMGHKIFRHSTPGNSDLVRDRQQQSSKIKIIKMLVTIVVLFVVCWLPLHVLNLFIYFARDLLEKVFKSQIGFTIYVAISFTAHWFSVANSFVNPFIYCFMSENFRTDLRDLFPLCLIRLNLGPRMFSISERNPHSINQSIYKRERQSNHQQQHHNHQRKHQSMMTTTTTTTTRTITTTATKSDQILNETNCFRLQSNFSRKNKHKQNQFDTSLNGRDESEWNITNEKNGLQNNLIHQNSKNSANHNDNNNNINSNRSSNNNNNNNKNNSKDFLANLLQFDCDCN